MGIFSFLRPNDINEGIKRYQSTPGALLLDVRTRGEYGEGHIPGSISLPLDELRTSGPSCPSSTPLFVYCLSGARSSSAVSALRRMGYANAETNDGKRSYRGAVEC